MTRDNLRRKGPATQVLLDTSFLLALLKQHRDPMEEIRAAIPGTMNFLVLDLVLLELERIARHGTSMTGAVASAALALIAKGKYQVVERKPGPSDVDASLMTYALTEKIPTVVATLDKGLRNSLAAYDLPAVWPRSRHGLVVERFRS